MSFHLYDSATRQLTELKPLVDGVVSIYCCGATVQSTPHLGHVRKEVSFDVLRRWLEYSGHKVVMITNVTDIDDKILARSAEAGRPWFEHAYLFEGEFREAYDILGCRRPTYEPRATGHIPEMVELIETLIERGHAYVAEDGSGDVYFDVRSWPRYGALSGQRVDEMEPAADADPRGKRDPRDFALWKGHKPGDPATASWPTPWGRGRPGWHLECSAMAGKYLGDAFDIHGGGIDLRFPHHENEMAQSQAAGRPFATHWMHNAFVTMAGEKMSKSLGNIASVTEVVKRHPARAVRLYLAGPHYRSTIELSEASLHEADAQLARIDSFLDRARHLVGGPVPPAPVPEAFAAALNDDLGTPAALAVLFSTIREGNAALEAGRAGAVRAALAATIAMIDVFGINPDAPEWAGDAAASGDLAPVVDALVNALLAQRQEARARKDWAAADAIRDALTGAGLKIEDTRDGARWSLERG